MITGVFDCLSHQAGNPWGEEGGVEAVSGERLITHSCGGERERAAHVQRCMSLCPCIGLVVSLFHSMSEQVPSKAASRHRIS